MTDQCTLADTQHLGPVAAEVSPQAFRSAFRRHPSGVAIVTAVGPAGPIGTTVTSVRSLSATPPLLAVSLNRTASVWPGLAAAPRFLVHLLGATQAPLAERFATSGVDRFAAPTRWSTDGAGLPRLADVAVVLTCEKTLQLPPLS